MKRAAFLTIIAIGAITFASASTIRSAHHSDNSSNSLVVQIGDQAKKDPTMKTVYTCSMHPEVIQDKPGKCPKCGMNLIAKEVKKDVYTCPMHPEVVQDKPGKCPKCGMNLVKKEPEKKSEPQKK